MSVDYDTWLRIRHHPPGCRCVPCDLYFGQPGVAHGDHKPAHPTGQCTHDDPLVRERCNAATTPTHRQTAMEISLWSRLHEEERMAVKKLSATLVLIGEVARYRPRGDADALETILKMVGKAFETP